MNMINQALCGPPRPPPETRLKKTEDRLEAHFANVTFESAIDTRCVEDEAAKRLGEVGTFLKIPAEEITVLGKIGEGTEKRVFEALWKGQRVAALEIFGPSMAWELHVQKRICEHAVLGTHPHVVRIYGATDDDRYILNEYAPLGSLTNYDGSPSVLSRRCPPYAHYPSAKLLAAAALQVAEAAAAFYDAGLLHRDLAARNVLAFAFDDRDVLVKLTDFGLVADRRLTVGGASTLLTAPYKYGWPEKHAMGTRWMAPEAMPDGDFAFDDKTEIYGLGVVLWELFSLGAVPYGDLRNDAIPAAKRSGAAPDVGELARTRGAATPAVRKVLAACVEQFAANRPTYAGLAASLRRLRDSDGATARDMAAPDASWTPLSPRVAALDPAYALDPRALALAAAPLPVSDLAAFGVKRHVLAASGDAVFAVPLLSEAFCDDLVEELVAFHRSGRETSRANSNNRHSMRVVELGWAGFLEPLVAGFAAPLSDALYGAKKRTGKRNALKFAHAHTVHRVCEDHTRRSPLPGSNRGSKHTDQAALTLNVNIGGEWKGGGVKFFDDAGNSILVPHERGRALVHPGRLVHQGTKLTEGYRLNLVIWTNR